MSDPAAAALFAAKAEVSKLILHRLIPGFFAHHAAIELAKDERARAHAPYSGAVGTQGDEKWFYLTQHYLEQSRNDPAIQAEMDRVWVYGSLLIVGDALTRNDFFDRTPEMELVRHLRNGIAHDNRFFIKRPDQLEKFPANNKASRVHDRWRLIEVTPDLDGKPVLPDFLSPGEAMMVISAVGYQLQPEPVMP